jgi:hypothetical protein
VISFSVMDYALSSAESKKFYERFWQINMSQIT